MTNEIYIKNTTIELKRNTTNIQSLKEDMIQPH